VLFHIQTEDSGVAHPHVITHLFTEGTILATKKTGYAELVSETDLEDKVRVLMKDQHKAMFLELRDGAHDEVAQKILALSGDALSDDHHVTPAKGEKSPLAAIPAAAIPKSPPPVPPQAKKAAQASTEHSGVRVILPAALGNKSKEQKSSPPPIPSPHPPAEPRRVLARSIFDTPDENGEFGESLISDKSLDEVILSYLTDDDLEI
jgi:hypothetical protein